ncbi:MAG: thiamine pyrophosphate-binding protein [Nannocystaceae bacterium]
MAVVTNEPAAGKPGTMADVFLRYLRAEGARVVFGVPGGLLHPFFAAVADDPAFRLIVARHECGAAFMADGFARTCGAMAVCAGTSGPGATNLVTGVACAYSDGVPMLVVTGQAPSHALGKGAAQETPPEDIDIVAMFKPITKYSTMIPGPARLAHHLRRALRLALTGRQDRCTSTCRSTTGINRRSRTGSTPRPTARPTSCSIAARSVPRRDDCWARGGRCCWSVRAPRPRTRPSTCVRWRSYCRHGSRPRRPGPRASSPRITRCRWA